MAASDSPGPTTNWQKSITCRYFIHGACRAGDSCRYAHDRTVKDTNNVCKFYLSGNCRFGASCRFDHVKPKAKAAGQSHANSRAGQSKARQGAAAGLVALDHAPGKMVTLQKGAAKMATQDHRPRPQGKAVRMEDLVGAAEFVPGQLYIGSVPPTYSAAALSGLDARQGPSGTSGPSSSAEGLADMLCPFAFKGTCRYGENCNYMHGEECDMCGLACLISNDPVQNKHHRELCMASHEKNMKEAFALQHSKGVQCAICMEVVLEKAQPKDRKFGLLSNCTHPYCLHCIRKWRSAKQYEKKVVRACPTCRVVSPFVTPSDFWVDDPEEKKTVLERYKQALSKKECKYFQKGSGTCPFGAECFYEHAYPDGTKEDRTKARQFSSGDGKLKAYRALSLWEFFEERENRLVDWDSDDDDDWFLYYDWSDDFDLQDAEDHSLWTDYFELFGSADSSDYSEDEEEVDVGRLADAMVVVSTSWSPGATAALADAAGDAGKASDTVQLPSNSPTDARPNKDCVYL